MDYKLENYADNVDKIVFENGKELYLIGTAHVSAKSVELVESVIRDIKPDMIAVELDEQRFESIKNENRYENIDIIKIIKDKQIFFFIGQLILSVFQKKVSQKTNSKPGEEFIKAIDLAVELDSKVSLIDRNIGVTLKRAWRINDFKGKMKIIGSLLFGSSKSSSVEAEDIEKLKSMDALSDMIKEMGKEMPLVKQVIIDERDLYLTGKLQKNLGDKTVAVVGAGHVPGMLEYLKTDVTESKLEEISVVPKSGWISKTLPWIIPTIVVALFVVGFFTSDKSVSKDAIIYWILINGVLSAAGALLAFGHPVAIVSAFIAAPITSLNPMIGAGIVVGLVQAVLVPPRVGDFKSVQDDMSRIKRWWMNRVTRLFLVIILSSIGSAVGTFVAISYIAKLY
ncbi:TraB/GumN family protein [bacterium]|nr:TraB/GumN family protein [bacterium]